MTYKDIDRKYLFTCRKYYRIDFSHGTSAMELSCIFKKKKWSKFKLIQVISLECRVVWIQVEYVIFWVVFWVSQTGLKLWNELCSYKNWVRCSNKNLPAIIFFFIHVSGLNLGRIRKVNTYGFWDIAFFVVTYSLHLTRGSRHFINSLRERIIDSSRRVS